MSAKIAVPSVIYSELGLLGTVLMYPTGFSKAKDCGIIPNDFVDKQNRTIWKAMEDLNSRTEPITSVSVLTELEKTGILNKQIQPAYIADLMTYSTTSHNIPNYAKQIKEATLRRMMMSTAQELFKKASDYDNALDDTLTNSLKTMMNASDSYLSGGSSGNQDSMLNYLEEEFGKNLDTFQGIKLQTGCPYLDNQLGNCIYPGMYVVAAISSLGKTTLVHQIADQIAEMGTHIIYFSIEQSRMELLCKSLARRMYREHRHDHAKDCVSSLQIRRFWKPGMRPEQSAELGGNLSAWQIEKINEAFEWYKQKIAPNMEITGTNFACTVEEIKMKIKRYTSTHDDKPVVVLDYIQIVQPEKDFRGTDKQNVDNIMTQLERTAKQENITIFAISSLNRGSYLAPVSFESLKEAGSIEYSSDAVWGLQLAAVSDFKDTDSRTEVRAKLDIEKSSIPRRVELHVLKNRYGRSGNSAYFNYYPDRDFFENVERKDQMIEVQERKW